MNLNNISCINCREKLKNFKNIIIHYIMHKNICPFCLAYYRSYKQFLIDSFYKKLMDITGEKIKYPTNDPDDPLPNDWLLNFHQTIRALFSSFIGNGFNLIIENEQIDVVPFGLTMDIPEFRASCKLNGHNSNEYACHTCDKPRDGLFICKSGTLRKQEDITNFHSTKPNYAELNADIELKKVWEKKAKDIGIKGVDRGWVEPLSINYLKTQPDILHNILLGVAQRCLNYIFDKYKNKIANFLNNLKNAKIIDNKPKPSISLFANKTRKGRENRSILYYLLISIKNQISCIEPESTALIIGNKIKNPDNLDNIKIKLDSLFQNYKNITFHSSIKNNKEIYNVGDAVEVASDNELSGRWSGIINSISMIEMDDNIIKHAILLNYFDKYVGDQFNKYHFLSNELNYITYDNILNNVIPIQIDDTNYLIIYKCHDKFSASKNKKSKN
ncbi:hypothetical protein ACTFIT_001763 [Dictyostelium discoideum]